MTSLNIKTLVLVLLGPSSGRADSSLCMWVAHPYQPACAHQQSWELETSPWRHHHEPFSRSVPTTVVKGKLKQPPSPCCASVSPSAPLLCAAAPLLQGAACWVCLQFAWTNGLTDSNWLLGSLSTRPSLLLYPLFTS